MSLSSFASAAEIARRVRAREVSPVEVAREHVERIAALNAALNAFVDWQPELVMEQARAAERALMRAGAGGSLPGGIGPLHGVPVSIKSSIDVAGHRCEAGSRLRAGYVAEADAPLVARLRTAGAVILGVTNTPEYLMAWETDNLLYGRTNNPWDLARTAGGSSGGEAAAIAAGLSAGGVGSDGGGSIRVPAHFCGICGLKPTPGRIPSTGHFPKSGGPFALLGVVGPMARTVEDLRVLFEVMTGWDDGDPCSAPVGIRFDRRERPHSKIAQNAILEWGAVESSVGNEGGNFVGFFVDDGRTPGTAETRAAVEGAASALVDAGLRVEGFRPDGLEEARELWWQFFGVAGGMILGPMVRGREAELSPLLQEFCSWTPAGHGAEAHSGESLLSAWLRRDELRERVLQQMRRYTVLICPVAAVPAFRHGEREWIVEGKTVKYLDAWSYCEWFNVLGFPAAVVPFGRSAEGLPIGVQIVGRPWEEEAVLEIAALVERAGERRMHGENALR
ncbi:MAG TPA: amidase [Terriglobales bacterium]|nr:amidase [Terriglobales bacterium]